MNEIILKAQIAQDYRGNPKIKITQDKPEVTFDVETDSIDILKNNVEKNWILTPLKDGNT